MLISTILVCGRGGIVFWADLVGPKHIYATLKKWSGVYGDFFKPSRFLEERATNGIPLVIKPTTQLLFEFMNNTLILFVLSFSLF